VGTGSESLEAICASLQIEGSLDQLGSTYSIRLPITSTFNLGTADVFKPIAFVSLQPTLINSRVRIRAIDLVINDQCIYHVVVCRNPTISGAYSPSWSNKANRAVRYWFNTSNAISVTSVEDSEIWAGIGSSGRTVTQGSESNLDSVDFFGSTFDDTPELFVVAVAADTANVNVLALDIILEEQA
jgi:hypothetical protein